jgi:hypothetical protein
VPQQQQQQQQPALRAVWLRLMLAACAGCSHPAQQYALGVLSPSSSCRCNRRAVTPFLSPLLLLLFVCDLGLFVT